MSGLMPSCGSRSIRPSTSSDHGSAINATTATARSSSGSDSTSIAVRPTTTMATRLRANSRIG